MLAATHRSVRRICSTALLAWLFPAGISAADPNDAQLQLSDWLRYVPVAGAAAYTAYRHDRDGLWQLAGEVGATAALTYGAKEAFDKTSLGERPNGGPHSFPSGHVSMACSGAAYLGGRYGWERSVPAYAVAAHVAYIRVHEDRHHIRDVVAGCALAWGVSQLIVRPFESRRVAIMPSIGRDIVMLGLQIRW